MHIKKGDNVKVLKGGDKGKTGTVEKAFPQLGKVLIGGINVRKVHQKAKKAGEKGQTVSREFPIQASNVVKV